MHCLLRCLLLLVGVLAPAASASAACPGAAAPSTASAPDALLARQWALQSLRVDEAWAAGRGAGAVVAVVDTGVDLGHPDLAGRLVPGADLWESRPGGGPDCPGPQDEDFHGTMVAGSIAAVAGNGIGIAGVAPEARVMPVRVRPTVGATDFTRVAAGIRWAVDHGADVVSLTGGVIVPVPSRPVLEERIAEAIELAWRRGVVVIATAGNNSLPWCQYPASSRRAVCAAATARDGRPAGYSQLPVRLGGDLALRAPGGSRTAACDDADIWTTKLRGATPVDGCSAGDYATDSGTTYATAHTAGVAALLAARGLDHVQIVACLREGAGSPGLVDLLAGRGSLDAARAVACAQRLR